MHSVVKQRLRVPRVPRRDAGAVDRSTISKSAGLSARQWSNDLRNCSALRGHQQDLHAPAPPFAIMTRRDGSCEAIRRHAAEVKDGSFNDEKLKTVQSKAK